MGFLKSMTFWIGVAAGFFAVPFFLRMFRGA